MALQYGYPADQRVINFILKDNFSSREVELEYGQPTRGGRSNGEVEFSQLTINGGNLSCCSVPNSTRHRC